MSFSHEKKGNLKYSMWKLILVCVQSLCLYLLVCNIFNSTYLESAYISFALNLKQAGMDRLGNNMMETRCNSPFQVSEINSIDVLLRNIVLAKRIKLPEENALGGNLHKLNDLQIEPFLTESFPESKIIIKDHEI